MKKSRKFSREDVIARFASVHGDKYDYSDFVYNEANESSTIICKKHGAFKQSYATHFLSKGGCMRCAKEKQGERQKQTTEHFIERSKLIHSDLYDYSASKYVGLKEKVKIICKKHGEFYMHPGNHYSGKGCGKCARESNSFWSSEKDEWLKENYLVLGPKKCAEILGNTVNSISSRACIVGASRPMSVHHPFISSAIWGNLLESVEENNYEFNIDREYVYELYLKQNKKCALSGLDVYFTKSKYEENTASIDRIDSKRGYTKDNIQITHKKYNIFKMANDQRDFLEMCQIVAQHLSKRYSKIEWQWDIMNDRECPVRVFSEMPILEADRHKVDWDTEDLF